MASIADTFTDPFTVVGETLATDVAFRTVKDRVIDDGLAC